MSDDTTVWPEYVSDPYARRPRPKRRAEGNPSVSARFDPCDLARMEHFAKRNGVDRAQVMRDGTRLLIDGYPRLTPERHRWLLALAAANDLGPDPQAALELLIDHLAARRPFAGRLKH